MSVTSVGCATFNAVSDSRPAATGKKASAERLVSIGRVFENQGKYDQAEDMYRKALKQRPNDPVIREQLTQLADRRAGRTFGPQDANEAIAMADAVSGGRKSSPAAGSNTAGAARRNSPPAERSVASSAKPETDSKVQFASATAGKSKIEAATAVREVAPQPPVEQVSVKEAAAVQPAAPRGITFEDVLAKTEGASGHAAWLRNAVCEGESTEARALAATLLAECDPAETETNTVLSSRLSCETDPGLRLAICESLATRGCRDEEVCEALIEISSGTNSELQVQAITCLRHFAGTEEREECLNVLDQLLSHENAQVRATAAVTIGDFTPESEATLGHLTKLAAEDSDETVREAARAAIGRRNPSSVETAEPIVIQPGTVN